MKGCMQGTFLILLLAFSLTGCKRGKEAHSVSTNGSKDQITVNIADDPSTLDPRKAHTLTDTTLIRMFMEGLTRLDKSGKITLAIAKKVDISPDKKTYTFTLRDCHWSNGDPVSSYDFSYSWKKSLSPKFDSPNANMLYVINNAEDIKRGKIPLSLVGIETPDEKTLVITLDHPTPYFMELIAHPVFFPVNRLVDRLNPQWADDETTYVGNGPFSLSEWKHHNILKAKKNCHYWDQKAVKLSNITLLKTSTDTTFTMFSAEEISWDGSPLSTLSVDTIPSLKKEEKLHMAPAFGTQWIRVNVAKTPFDNKNFRKALAYAMDRETIINHATQGNQVPATGIVPTAMHLQQSPLFMDHDISAAQNYLNQAFEELNVTIDTLPVIPLLYPSSERNHLIAQIIQDQWLKTFGIRIELEAVEKKVFFDRVEKKNYVLSLGNWFADFNDPINFLEIFKTRDASANHTNWENTHYTQLLETSYHCQSDEERQTVLAESEQLLMDEMPVIPIFHHTLLYTQDQKLKDVALTTMGSIDFKWAYLE